MFRIKFITRLIHINEWLVFYPRLRRFYKKHLKGDSPVIIDVGSNKGQTIDFFLKHFRSPVIYGFEPNHKLYAQLVKKYASNPNITITNCGISNQPGKLLFKETVISETSTFEDINPDSSYLKMKSKVLGVDPADMITDTYEVEVTTLQAFLQKHNISKIDVIKIDTEGHEYKCLTGLFGSYPAHAAYIQLEQHHDDMYSNAASQESITALLNKNGYKLLEAIRHGFGGIDEIIFSRRVVK